MPIARIGYGTDFILKDQGVGIATDTADIKLKVGGTTKANYNITGIASLTNYAGFSAAEQNIAGVTTVTGEHSTLGDIVVGVGSVLNVSTGATVCTGSVESISITGHFAPPCGGIEDREECPVEGTVRFNKDLNTLEFYNGVDWRQFTVSGVSGRALFGGGDDASGKLSNISSLQFMTLGNAVFFGDLTVARTNPGGCASEIRAVFAGGEAPSANNTIDYNAIASGGTGADFGNLLSNHRYKVGCSSSTRGLFGAGSTPSATNVIEYVEIATTGDAVDFGDLMGNGMINSGSFASRIRGFFVDKAVSIDQEVQVVTIASKGNSVSYLPQGLPGGDGNGDAGRGCSNSTRGIFVGAGQTKNIDCVDLVSDGITYDFGDMTQAKYGVGCSASPLRGVLYGGWTPTKVDTIEYVTFASMGDAVDFGDATHEIREVASNVSDCHGGLGGY